MLHFSKERLSTRASVHHEVHAAQLGALQDASEDARQATILEAPPAAIVTLQNAMKSCSTSGSTATVHNTSELVTIAEPR